MNSSIICFIIFASLLTSIASTHAQSAEWEALNMQVNTLYQQGKYDEAIEIAKKALDIAEKTLGPDPHDVATSLYNLAALYYAQGQYAKAEPLYQRLLAIQEKALGPDHPNVATILNDLAAIYYIQGQYAKAESLYQRSLAIWEKALGPDHPNVATSFNNLAELYRAQGQYAKAEPLYQRLLAIQEKALSPDHPNVATSFNNLAELYRAQGQYAKAEPLYLRSLAIREKTLGPEHSYVAQSLDNLGGLYLDQGQYAKAEFLRQRALTIFEKALGPEHLDVAKSLNNLAVLYQVQSQYAKAVPFYQRALAIFEKTLGPEHPEIAKSLNNLAILYVNQGHYAKAEPLYLRSLAIREKTLGPEHPDVVQSLENLAVSFWAQGGPNNIAHALELFQRANTIQEHHLQQFLVRGSEQDKRDYMATIHGDPNIMTSFHLSVGSTNIAAARLALTVLLQRKGRLLDAMSEGVATLRRHMKPEDEALLVQLAEISEQRAHLFMQAQHANIPSEQYFYQKSQLEVQAQELEKTISSRSAEFLSKSQPITLEKVQQTIPKDSALIEYLRYHPINPKAQREEDIYAPAHYIAYILRSTGDPQSVELGDAAAIDQLVNDWRKALADSRNPFFAVLARKLHEIIMQPVRKLMGDVRSVLISPDGALNLIPFAALKDEHDRYLVEQVALTYLSSGRDLLRFDTKIESQQPVTLLADVDFGKVDKKTKSVPSDRSATHRRSGDYQGEFQPLPGTKAEAQAIGKILPAATILTGQQASESKLKQLDRPNILHIATHGFFLSDLPDNIAKTRGVPLLGISQSDLPHKNNPLLNENPLLRSGLALANANRLESGEDDGVLTAMEAANLDLWGTQLVVLSACETGVGEVQNGQGVFGLRRALVIAGSESQVMSLWKVDDDATKDLMVDYYQRLLVEEGRSDAMRQVQLTMLKSPDRNHPYYWASFIVSGNWKPMDKKELMAVKRR